MRVLAAAAIWAVSANAAWLGLNNYCTETLYVSSADQDNWTPPVRQVPSGQSYMDLILGEGNQLGVSLVEDYYNENTPRFIMGTSVKDGTLWWTINQIGGDPFEGEPFNVSSSDNKCGYTTGYNLDTHNCPDGDFYLFFNPCVDNS